MERYQGKNAVIIGGTSGMGLATAKMLLDGGARVLVTGRSRAGLESAHKELGRRCRTHDLDRQRQGNARTAAYGADKAALRSFARTLATELLPEGIRVNAVTPGPIDTPIVGKAFPDKDVAAQMREKMTGMVPMKRWGTSEELAKAVLFLAFDATFMTGAELPVDGGWSQL
jgi:NAD(P)-dependent dehydrogenase (short-subunit alcohol dehydrogenase family)